VSSRNRRSPPSADGMGRRARNRPARETRRFDFRLPDTMLDVVPPTMLASAPFPMAACERRHDRPRRARGRHGRGRAGARGTHPLRPSPRAYSTRRALKIARGSRLTPAYRDGQAIRCDGAPDAPLRSAPRDLPRREVAGSQAVRRPTVRRPPSRTTNGPLATTSRGPACPRTAAQPLP
jgi:hypothetical protein